MNWLDLVLILLVALAAAAGVWTGVIRAAFGTLGVVLGVLIAGQASDDLGGLYASYIASETLANVIAYGLIILVSWMREQVEKALPALWRTRSHIS